MLVVLTDADVSPIDLVKEIQGIGIGIGIIVSPGMPGVGVLGEFLLKALGRD